MLEDHQAAAAAAPPAAQSTADAWPSGYPEGYAVVDVETTGLGRDDRIVSVAVYQLGARGDVEDHWYSVVNPQRDPGPTWIHGLTAEMLADAPLFADIAGELGQRLTGRVLVAHNAVFDWTMLAREYARAGGAPPVEQRLCTIRLSKVLGLPLKNHKLETLAAYFGVAQRRAHHALDDARVLAEAFRPSLHRAAARRLALPLLSCVPLSEWAAVPAPGGPRGGRQGWRSGGRRRPCPYPNPGRYEPGGRLMPGMRVAFSGDTAVERDLLEERACAAGLGVTNGVTRTTSLLVTNDPDAVTSKVLKAKTYGTPVVDEAEFTRLLADAAPPPEA